MTEENNSKQLVSEMAEFLNEQSTRPYLGNMPTDNRREKDGF